MKAAITLSLVLGITHSVYATSPEYYWVSAGEQHTCALDDNGVTCWGYNGMGQTDVPALSNPTQVSLGGSHTCALDDNGVTCWGSNNYGQTDVPTSLSFTYPSAHQVPHPLWLYGILLAGLGILGVRGISQSRP